MTENKQGSATVQGRLWGAAARDWADIQQYAARPSWQAVVTEQSPLTNRPVLDIGCGAGGFAELAHAAGAHVTGVDASDALIAVAEERVPEGSFRIAEMEQLPYADGSFEVVTGFNSFQYAAEPVAALREAKRVAEPGGALIVMIWGTEQECEPAAHIAALGALMPPVPPGRPGPFALSEPGGLEKLLADAGLMPGPRAVTPCPWEFPDEQTLLRGMLSSGPARLAIGHSGLEPVREAVLTSCAPYRRADGSYRMDCTFHHVTCAV